MVVLMVKNCCVDSISYFRISIFDPLSQTVEMEGSYHLLSQKDSEKLKYFMKSLNKLQEAISNIAINAKK